MILESLTDLDLRGLMRVTLVFLYNKSLIACGLLVL